MDPAADPGLLPEEHFGRLADPTWHAVFNALRRVGNELIGRFGGPPKEIHLELSAELKRSRAGRDALASRLRRRAADERRIRARLAGAGLMEAERELVRKVGLW